MGRVHKRKVGKARVRHPKYRSLVALARDILADGKIDSEEVRAIRTRVYADGQVDQEEADFLFKLNDATGDKVPEWKPLFVGAIADFLLDDPVSPGVVDAGEAEWLVDRIQGDGQIDDNEKALLLHLKNHAVSVHESVGELMEG